jgi:hypothetical protein
MFQTVEFPPKFWKEHFLYRLRTLRPSIFSFSFWVQYNLCLPVTVFEIFDFNIFQKKAVFKKPQ